MLTRSDRILARLVVERGLLAASDVTRYAERVRAGRADGLLAALVGDGRIGPGDEADLRRALAEAGSGDEAALDAAAGAVDDDFAGGGERPGIDSSRPSADTPAMGVREGQGSGGNPAASAAARAAAAGGTPPSGAPGAAAAGAADAARRGPADLDLALAKVAMERGLVTAVEVRECFQAQADFAAIGRSLPLGQMLIKRRALDVDTFVDIVREVKDRSVVCPGCGALSIRPRLEELPPGMSEAECRRCKARLRLSASATATPIFGVPRLGEVEVEALSDSSADGDAGGAGARGDDRDTDDSDSHRPFEEASGRSPAEPPELGGGGLDAADRRLSAAAREGARPPLEVPAASLGGGLPAFPKPRGAETPSGHAAPAPAAAAPPAAGPDGKAPKKKVKHEPLAGRRLGRYEILSEIARGGMGVVYRARDTEQARVVALKVLKAGVGATERQVRRFKRETQTVGKLHHANIVPIYDVGFIDDQHYFTMELIDGQPLDEVIRLGPFEIVRSLEIAEQLARAIHHAHEQGVIHRDLKPANVLLDRRGVPMITDFGLAKDIDHTSQMTRSGAAVGTPYYMPPEQAKGDRKKIDRRVDVYAIGVVLFEMLTGELPFDGETTVEVYHKIMTEDAPHPSAINPRVDEDIDLIVAKAMAKERADRYPTALALADDLRRRLDGKPIEARPPSALTLAGRRVVRFGPALAALGAAALVLASVFFLWSTLDARTRLAEAQAQADKEYQRVVGLAASARAEAELKLGTARVDLADGRAAQARRTASEAIRQLRDHGPWLAELHHPELNERRLAAHLVRFTAEDCRELLRDLSITLGRAIAAEGGADVEREALAAFAAALDLDPSSVEALSARGRFLASRERWTEALASFGEALRIDARNVPALLERGAALEALGRYGEAIEDYRAVVTVESARHPVVNQSVLAPGGRPGPLAVALARVAACDLRLDRPKAAVERLDVLIAGDSGTQAWFVLRSEARLLAGDVPGAIEDARNGAIDVDRRSPEGFHALARAELAQGELERARDQLREALRRDEQHAPSLALLGLVLERDGDLLGARKAYQDALAAGGGGHARERALASVRLGDLHRMQGLWQNAISAYDEALRLDRREPAAYLGRARAWLGEGAESSLDRALEDGEAALRQGAPEDAAYVVLAIAELRKGAYEAAARHLQRAVAAAGGGLHPEAKAWLGDVEKALHGEAAAVSHWRRALADEQALQERAPEQAIGVGNALRPLWELGAGSMRPDLEAALGLRRARRHLATTEAQAERIERGQRACERAVGWGARSSLACERLARALLERGLAREALGLCDRAIEANPALASAYILRAEIRLGLDGAAAAEAALADLGRAVELEPDHGVPHLERGLALERLGRRPAAIQDLRVAARLLAVQPQADGRGATDAQRATALAEAYRGLARLYEAEGQREEARVFEGHARAAGEQNREAALAALDEGRRLFEAGKVAEAIRRYDQALEIAPRLARAWQLKSIAYFRLANLPQAVRCWARALALDVYYADLLFEQLNADSGQRAGLDLEPLRLGLEKALELTPDDADALLLLGAYPVVADYLKGTPPPPEVTAGALARLDKLLAKDDQHVIAHLLRAYALALLDRRAEAAASLARAGALDLRTYTVPYVQALLHARWGEREQALAALERAFERGLRARPRLEGERALDPLRDEPRFKALLDRLAAEP